MPKRREKAVGCLVLGQTKAGHRVTLATWVCISRETKWEVEQVERAIICMQQLTCFEYASKALRGEGRQMTLTAQSMQKFRI